MIVYLYKKDYKRNGVKIVEEKKVTKISLSTFFLILAIIAICVMSYFIYKLNDDKVKVTEQVSQLNNKVTLLENNKTELKAEINEYENKQTELESKENTDTTNNTISDNSTVENSLTFSSLSGIYVGDAKVEPGTTPDGETEVKLYLYENGSFEYNDSPGLGSGKVGYYTFSDNSIILHEVLLCANDIGRTITSDTMTLKINSDNSITDSKLNAILEKSSQKIENKTDIISTELKNALDNNSLQ
jgi:cell division protein FtsB